MIYIKNWYDSSDLNERRAQNEAATREWTSTNLRYFPKARTPLLSEKEEF